MVDAKNILKQTLVNIVKEQEYKDYETELRVINSGGANYTSQLHSIILSAPGKDDLKLFAKVATLGEKMRSMTTLQVFKTDIMFYTKILTKYKELKERYNFPEEVRMVLPKYYSGSTEYMKETLMLEDLTVKGYQPFDRFKCYDWEYASQTLSILARFHALSVAFARDDPEQYSSLIPDVAYTFPEEEMKGFIDKSIADALKVTAEEHRERLAKFLKENMTVETVMKYYNPSRKILLCHGDFRPNNVMHTVDENGKLEVVIIDYQIIQKGNPLTDLLYFFILGSDEEFRQQYKQQYFDCYYKEFSTTLRRLEIDPDDVYSKGDFDADLKEFLRFGLALGIYSLPFVTVDETDAPKVEDGIDIYSFSIKVSDLFGTRLNGLVRDYIKWGYL